MKKRTTVYVDKKAWKSTWQKKRSKGMTLSGRKDAVGGNFMVRYIPETGILTYHAQNGTDVRMKVGHMDRNWLIKLLRLTKNQGILLHGVLN
jgi:hypothetical protein